MFNVLIIINCNNIGNKVFLSIFSYVVAMSLSLGEGASGEEEEEERTDDERDDGNKNVQILNGHTVYSLKELFVVLKLKLTYN